LLLEPEMRATLALVGATPGHGVEFLRPHYMLELVRATRTGHSLSYDWSLLDRAVDTMVEFGFRPFFELMGNPSGVFAGFTERNDILVWRDFVAELVRRFVERYGAEEVSKWISKPGMSPISLGGNTAKTGLPTTTTPALPASMPLIPHFAWVVRALQERFPICSRHSSPIATAARAA
jgi:L-iduronidase